jgi:putative DNA methylase
MAEAMHNLAEDARVYNEVVTGWSGIESAAVKIPGPKQGTLFDNEGDTRPTS